MSAKRLQQCTTPIPARRSFCTAASRTRRRTSPSSSPASGSGRTSRSPSPWKTSPECSMLSAPPSRLPILVIDDDSAPIRTLSDILRLHGYSPETAETALEGLALAERHPPALAVVDLRLPDMDGVELAAKLHALSERIEVVMLTGNASVASAIAALRHTSVDYLLKPVQVQQLLALASVATQPRHHPDPHRSLHQSAQP